MKRKTSQSLNLKNFKCSELKETILAPHVRRSAASGTTALDHFVDPYLGTIKGMFLIENILLI